MGKRNVVKEHGDNAPSRFNKILEFLGKCSAIVGYHLVMVLVWTVILIIFISGFMLIFWLIEGDMNPASTVESIKQFLQ